MKYPPGHVWGLALILEPADTELMWRLADKPYVTLPDDLQHFPDYAENGLVIEVLDRLCVKCWRRFDLCVWQACEADTTNGDHLRGGDDNERAGRSRPKPGTTAKEIAAKQAAARERRERREAARTRRQSRELVALMQGSRITGLS
ncbi:hypothetical protein ACFOY2_45895 [Nonomuraea purpurea]|uniref:Uncharacterized protein n=1 Tax=Nonomuraea purpurea TaxID=1849276 RepID=A0ABV8GNM1_9ACTN